MTSIWCKKIFSPLIGCLNQDLIESRPSHPSNFSVEKFVNAQSHVTPHILLFSLLTCWHSLLTLHFSCTFLGVIDIALWGLPRVGVVNNALKGLLLYECSNFICILTLLGVIGHSSQELFILISMGLS